VLDISDDSRVRVLRLNRVDALNAFNEALYDATTDALLAAADDPAVAVVVITGSGRAFCAGTDLLEMARRSQRDPTFVAGRHGFAGFVDVLTAFPKPLIIAVNGIGVGIGATILGYADLAFMSTAARLRCPFTSLGVAPEAASSFTFPQLVGRQHATWALMSSEWLSADECVAMGLVWRQCEPDELMPVTLEHARTLAALPISSLIETKRTIVESLREPIAAARKRENAAFAKLMGGPANTEALKAFAEKRPPDFTSLPPGW
jgi:enoyl-CoA hydratase/carnithine racemase